MKKGVIAVCTVLLAGLAAGCAETWSYTMIAPQVSGENRFVSGDLEIQFGFTPDTIRILVTNSSLNNVTVNWNLCSFVDAQGRMIRLEPVGESPVANIPPGAATLVEFTLAEWSHPPATLWHRRQSLKHQLVYQEQLGGGGPASVSFNMAVAIWETDEMNRLMRKDQRLTFQFAVQSESEVQGRGRM